MNAFKPIDPLVRIAGETKLTIAAFMPIEARISHAKNSHSSQNEGDAEAASPDFLYFFLLTVLLFWLFLDEDEEVASSYPDEEEEQDASYLVVA